MRFTSGRVRASVWRNVRRRQDGTSFVAWQINIERRYQDKQGNWKSTSSYDRRDLESVEALAKEARSFINKQEQTAEPATAAK